jgi:hypothetical protein
VARQSKRAGGDGGTGTPNPPPCKDGVHYGDEYEKTGIPGYGSDETTRLSDFTVRPHMDADTSRRPPLTI